MKKSKKCAHFPVNMDIMVEKWMHREVPHLLGDNEWKDIFASCWLDASRRTYNIISKLELENDELKEEIKKLKENHQNG